MTKTTKKYSIYKDMIETLRNIGNIWLVSLVVLAVLNSVSALLVGSVGYTICVIAWLVTGNALLHSAALLCLAFGMSGSFMLCLVGNVFIEYSKK